MELNNLTEDDLGDVMNFIEKNYSLFKNSFKDLTNDYEKHADGILDRMAADLGLE